MKEKNDKAKLEKLCRAMLSLETVEECEAFFRDAFTMQEAEAIAQRLEVACLLNDGKSYADVNRDTGASTATICRVSRCLNYGSGGYKTVISRMEKND